MPGHQELACPAAPHPLGMVIFGTVVLGTVTGPPPPPPVVDDEPDPETAGFPGPVVRYTRTSSVPESAVVTKPPRLGLAMFHRANTIGRSARRVDPVGRALRGQREAHLLADPVHVQGS